LLDQPLWCRRTEEQVGAEHPTVEVIAAAGQAYTDALGIGLTLAAA
jgi:hypothetical protein